MLTLTNNYTLMLKSSLFSCEFLISPLFLEMMPVPSELRATDFTWDSFKLSWSKPAEGWLPKFYKVQVCLKINSLNCVTVNELKDKWEVKFQSLLQFRLYDVKVEAFLQPVDLITASQIGVMTCKLT